MLDHVEFSVVNAKNYAFRAEKQLIGARKKQRQRQMCVTITTSIVCIGKTLSSHSECWTPRFTHFLECKISLSASELIHSNLSFSLSHWDSPNHPYYQGSWQVQHYIESHRSMGDDWLCYWNFRGHSHTEHSLLWVFVQKIICVKYT